MASNLIPMLSSSPPPMDENGSFDEEEDDFGDFTCAGGVKVLDSPLSSPIKSSIPSLSSPEDKPESEVKKVTWNDHPQPELEEEVDDLHKPPENSFTTKDGGSLSEKIVVFSEDVEEFNCEEDEMDFGEEKNGLSAKYAFTHSEQHDNTSQESVTDSGLCSSSQRSETSPLPPGETMFSELSPETEVEDSSEAFPDEPRLFELKSDFDNSVLGSEEVTESYDDNTTPVNEPQSFSESLYISQTLDDDVDEFQDFVTSGEACEARTERCASEENDDFADFECARFEPVVGVSTPAEVIVDDDAFADFSQVSFEGGAATEESWANFESSEGSPFADAQIPGTSQTAEQYSLEQPSSSRTAQVQLLVSCAFPGPTEMSEEEDQSAFGPILGSETSTSCLLWRHLEDLDGSISLQYQWSGSHTFQKTLHALNIDSRNVLHNSSVPLFALGLGELLQPVKLEQDQRPDPPTTITTAPNEQAEEGIPPAQFDWSSSGLVNPLDPSQSSSTLLDLDFFVESSSSTSSSTKLNNARTSSLEEEFLGMDPMGRPPTQPGREDLVQKLLLSVSASSFINPTGPRATSETSPLSAQATHLLELIPDLSFMKAKVLMFPIRGTTES